MEVVKNAVTSIIGIFSPRKSLSQSDSQEEEARPKPQKLLDDDSEPQADETDETNEQQEEKKKPQKQRGRKPAQKKGTPAGETATSGKRKRQPKSSPEDKSTAKRTKKESTKRPVKVKEEPSRRSARVRAVHKKGFYNERNLASLVWKGAGTAADPIVIY